MIRALRLECIADDLLQTARALPRLFGKGGPSGPWVARLTGLTPTNFQREFLRGMKDYSQANSVGSRGVYLTFWLDSNDIYEVYHRTAWKNDRRYFCRPTKDGTFQKLTREEARAWLSAGLALPY